MTPPRREQPPAGLFATGGAGARRGVAAALVMALGLAAAPAGAEALSRGAAVARALAQNPQVAAARAVEMQARAHYGQARAARAPTVTVELGVGPSLKAELSPGSAVASTENTYGDVGLGDLSVVVGGQLAVTQPLYTFGKIGERQSAAEHEIRARRAETEMTRAGLALQVAELYEGWLYARDSESFFGEAEHWLVRTLEDTQREARTGGDVGEQDVLRLQAALSTVRLGAHRAHASQREAEAGLIAYLLLPPGSSLAPKEEGLAALPAALPPQAELVQLALGRRPELAALSEGSLAYAALGRAEAAGNLPDFFALGIVSAAYTPGRDFVTTRYVQDPLNGFYPSLLIGARWQVTGRMATERADEQNAKRNELEQLRGWALSGLPAEVAAAYEDVQRARTDREQSQPGVEHAKQWLVRASADFSIGLGNSRDVTDAASAYVELRLADFDAMYRNNVALATLSKATGTLDQQHRGFYPTREE